MSLMLVHQLCLRCTCLEGKITSINNKVIVWWKQSIVNAKGLQNPEGIGQGYLRVRVRVQNSELSTNPYP